MNASIIVSIDTIPVLAENFICHLDKYPGISDYEVVFTDDGGYEAWILQTLVKKNFHHAYQYIPNETKQGYSIVNNNAVRYASSNILIFINSDVILVPGCLDIMISRLKSPDIDAVQPLLIYPQTGLVQSTGHVFSKNHNAHLLENRRTDEEIVQLESDRESFTTALCCMEKQTFVSNGGFDEFFFNAWDGMELGLKITHNGGKIRYVPEAKAYHIRGGGRGLYSIDERPQSAEFWSRWGQLITPDVNKYFNLQLKKVDTSSKYVVLNFSCLRDIDDILYGLGLDIIKTIFFTEYSGVMKIEFFKTLPYYWLNVDSPLIFFVNNISSVKGNAYWLESRRNKHDLVMDLSGNCVPSCSFYQSRGSK